MPLINSFIATIHTTTCSRRRCHELFHRRLLQHPKTKRCTYHQLLNDGRRSVVLLPTSKSSTIPFTRANSSCIRNHSLSLYRNTPPTLRCTYQSQYVTCNNYSHNAAAVKGVRHYHDDDLEPEYLEPVTHTADKMRSAVRDYIAEHSRTCHDSNGRSGVDMDKRTDHTKTTLDQYPPPPIKLVGILATNSPHPISRGDCHQNYINDTHGNERYSEQIATSCSSDGIIYEPWRVPPTRDALERAIHHANERLDVHGILVFYPVDKLTNTETIGRTYKCQGTGVYYRSMDDYFRDLVACNKDVEGYRRKGLRIQKPENNDDDTVMNNGDSQHIVKAEELGPIYPCTALAVYKILETFHHSAGRVSDGSNRQFENITMTIINRSEVLGLPLATMLSNQGATVYSINIDSILQFLPNGKVRREHAATTMEHCVRNSSVIVSGVPSMSFKVPSNWIPENATVINVATESNFEEDSLHDKAFSGTYVPHVGRVTVAALEYNLMSLHKNYHSK